MNSRSVTLPFIALIVLATVTAPALIAQTDALSPPRTVAGEEGTRDARGAIATSAPALDLPGAIALALARNPELEAAHARIEAAAGRSKQAALWSNPELTVDAEDWPVNGGRGLSDAKQTVGVAQTVPFPGKKSLGRKIGASGVRISEAEAAARRLGLIKDVKSAFFQVLAADEFSRIAAELVRVAEAAAGSAEKRVRAGAAPEQELLRAEVVLEQARAELAAHERDALTHRQTLAGLLGGRDTGALTVSGTLGDTWGRGLLAVRFEDRLATHPEVLAAALNAERAELGLRRAHLEPYPDVRVGVSGGRIGESGRSIVQVGLAVPLPLIDRGQGAQREAKANVRVATAERHAVEQRLRREWAGAVARARTAGAQVAGYRERIVPKANTALQLVQTGFDEGKFSLIDLLDTQRTAAEARLAQEQKLLELNLALVDLEALAGEDAGTASAASSPLSPQTRTAGQP